VKNKQTYTVKEAQQVLEHFCSYQERTHKEVAGKLYKMGMIPQVIDEITISLMQNNFLNEERYAKAFVGGKFRINKWGRIKIKQALALKGVSSQNIQIGLAEINQEAYQNAIIKLLNKKSVSVKAKNKYEKKQKLLKYLQQKGYEINLVLELIDESL
jgi:regulatory protein